MRNLYLILISLTLCFSVSAQTADVQALRLKIEGKRVSLKYSAQTSGKVPVKYSGTLLLQDGAYRSEGNGLLVICDSTTRWTIDESAKEVYIETAADLTDYFAHPETFLEGVSNLKIGSTTVSGTISVPESDEKCNFRLTEIKTTEKGEDLSPFTFDVTTLDSSWVVTDLR